MLTKSDLLDIKKIVDVVVQKQTRKIVQEETTRIVQLETRKIVQEETRKIVHEETRKIVQEELAPVKKDIKGIKSELKKVRKTVDVMGRLLDGEQMKQRKRIIRIEEHLGFAQI